MKHLLLASLSVTGIAFGAAASAASDPIPDAPTAGTLPPKEPGVPQPPPYSLPFQLRPAVASSVVRSDTAIAFYQDPVTEESGTTVASMLLASYPVVENFAPLIRVGLVSNSPPDVNAGGVQTSKGTGVLNPVLGATYALKPAKPLRLAFFLGVTLPVGEGGGNDPDPGEAAANARGIQARSAMDNAMFAVNDLTVFPGVDFAYVDHGFTAQVEATLLQLTRVRGEDVQPDSSRTNFTAGVFAGYFVLPMLSLGAELRHQRWLSTPTAVENDPTDTLRDTTTVAFGPRGNFKVGDKMFLRPAVTFAIPLDDPLQNTEHRIVQVDVPFAF